MSRREHEGKETTDENAPAQTDGGDKIKIGIPKLTKKQLYAIVVGILFFGSSAAFAFYSSPSADADTDAREQAMADIDSVLADERVGPLGGIHEHFTISVVLDGVPIDFSKPKYQLRDQRYHFEGGDGSTGHMHATGITMDYAFRTLGMTLTPECFTLDGGRSFCTGEKTLEMFVNGRSNTAFQTYAPKDGDTIVITYG